MDERFKYTPDFFEKVINGTASKRMISAFEESMEADPDLKRKFEFFKMSYKMPEQSEAMEAAEEEEVQENQGVTIEEKKTNRHFGLIALLFIVMAALLFFQDSFGKKFKYASQAAILYEMNGKDLKVMEAALDIAVTDTTEDLTSDKINAYNRQVIAERKALQGVISTLKSGDLPTAKTQLDAVNPAGFKENRSLNDVIRYMILLEDDSRSARAEKFWTALADDGNSQYQGLAKKILE